MAEDVIIARFQADLESVQAEFEKYIKTLNRVEKEEKDLQTQTTKSSNAAEAGAKKRTAAATKEESSLKKLNASIKTSLTGVATGIAAAFSIDAIISFSKASVNAFLEAEDNANRLKFAITAIGKESEAAFNRLIDQSERLQDITVFSDDSVQQAQAALAAFGLTSDEIEKLIPKLADFATITSQDLPSAAQQIGAALEGNGREFKKYGIEVSAAASRTENLGKILDGLTQFQGAAENATNSLSGSLKQQQNQLDELQETIGNKLAPAFVALKREVLEFIDLLLTRPSDIREQSRLDQIADAATKTTTILKERAKSIESIYNVTPNEAFIRALEAEIKLATEARDLAASQNTAKSAEEYFEASQRLDVLNKELEAFNKTQEEANRINQEAASRTLSLTTLQKKSTEDLIKLAESEREINDKIAKENIKNIDLVLKAREDYEAEYAKSLERLRQLEISNTEDQKLRRIKQFEKDISDIKVQGKLRKDLIAQLEIDLKKDLQKIDEEFGNTKIEPIELKVKITTEGDLPVVDPVNPVPETLEIPPPDGTAFNDGIADIEASTLDGWIRMNDQMLESSQQLLGTLEQLFDQYYNNQILKIEKNTDAEIDSIDTQLQATKDALKEQRVTEREASNTTKQLEAQKVKAKQDSEKKINEIKRKQFNIDKAASLIQITIDTAQAAAASLASVPLPAGAALLALNLASGAAQAALVAAQKNPYRKGTKSARKGLAWVDEEGKEAKVRNIPGRMTTLEYGDKVVPFKQSKKFEKVFDAMVDDRFEEFVFKTYISPIIKTRKDTYQQTQEQSFAENITKSMVVNNMMSGRGDFYLERMSKNGIRISNPEDFKQSPGQRRGYKR